MVDGLSGASAVTRQWVVHVSLASFDSHVNLSSIQLEKREERGWDLGGQEGERDRGTDT